ncbi:unnamed protein product [Musa acuminata subsp. burmannicoides]
MAEGDEDQTIDRPIFAVANDTSPFSCPFLLGNPHEHGADGRGFHPPRQQLPQQETMDQSSDHWISRPTRDQDIGKTIELNWCKDEERHEWMSSEMRIMKKTTISEDGTPRGCRQTNCSINPPADITRVCSICKTTKTPLWRGGPRGPKSLCNACGIRQRKARRAMEAAARGGGGLIRSDAPTKIRKEKKPNIRRTLPFKKRCKITTASTSQKQLGVEDVEIGLSSNSAFYEVFPQDERDAATLLMALSCGLIRG